MVVVTVLRGHHPRYILKVGIFSDLLAPRQTPKFSPQHLELTLPKIGKTVGGMGLSGRKVKNSV